MAKTIVIKGASYSANALDHVAFGNVPCTGISLEESSYSLTDSDPVEVEYTVTPEDTTDQVTWSSSDTSVVTVVDGVLTAVGIGSATVTATCGNYSDTATVNVSISYIANWQYGSGSQDNESKYVRYNSSALSRIMPWGSGSQAAEYACPDTATDGRRYAIKIPENTAQVRISYNIDKKTMLYNEQAHVLWMSDESCEVSAFTDCALFVSTEDVDMRTSGSATLNVPSGANLFTVVIRLASTRTEQDDPATDAQTIGLNVEFLPAT